MLVTYSKLLNALLAPPQTVSSADVQQEWQRYVEWITVLSQNIMAAANDLRPVQVSWDCTIGLIFTDATYRLG
jgi:mediator of RNA polymerase II transcription subunit 7